MTQSEVSILRGELREIRSAIQALPSQVQVQHALEVAEEARDQANKNGSALEDLKKWRATHEDEAAPILGVISELNEIVDTLKGLKAIAAFIKWASATIAAAAGVWLALKELPSLFKHLTF